VGVLTNGLVRVYYQSRLDFTGYDGEELIYFVLMRLMELQGVGAGMLEWLVRRSGLIL
jgi:hypothetical protein